MSHIRARGGVVALAVVAALALSTTGGAAVATEVDDGALGAYDVVTLADNLAEAAAEGADSAEELSAAVGLPVSGAGSLTVNDAGQVSATVTFSARPTEDQLAAVGLLAEVEEIYSFSPSIGVMVEPEQLIGLEEVAGVTAVVPVLAPSVGTVLVDEDTEPSVDVNEIADGECRSFPAEGNVALRSDIAREAFDVDGTGVTIGIISDSYGRDTTITSPQDDVAAGLLPGPGNPCGYETPVEVLAESSQDTPIDEGRAMAQLVHGIAPGARILFAEGLDGGPENMADNIIALADAGADVIVDDLGFLAEPTFQQGILSAAIVEVQSRGVAYYAAAGNDNFVGVEGSPSEGKPVNGWQTTQYEPTACPAGLAVPERFVEYDCLDFDPGEGIDPRDKLRFSADSGASHALAWAEPVGGVTSDFVLVMYFDGNPSFALQSVSYSAAMPISYVYLPPLPVDFDVEIAVVRNLSAETVTTPTMRISTMFGRGPQWREHDESQGNVTVGVTAYGHQADGSGEGIGAAPADRALQPEEFSSIGPSHIVYEPFDPFGPVAQAYSTPLTVPAPVLTGVDALRTSFFGRERIVDGEKEYFFPGTSAAAPTVAAVHALAAEYSPQTEQDVIVDLLTQTAQEMINPYEGLFPDDAVFGAGLADANALLAALPAGAVSGVTVEALSSSSATVQWNDVAGAAGYRVELSQAGSVVSTNDVAGDVTLVALDDLSALTTYSVRVAALNAADDESVWSEQVEFMTMRPVAPDVVPPVPDASALTPDAAGGLVATPSTVDAGASLVISGLPTQQWVYGWLFSIPVGLGWSWSDASGTAAFTVPANAPVGAHQLALSSADGSLLGWASLTVQQAADGGDTDGGSKGGASTADADLAVTGSALNPGAITAAALLVLLAGAASMVWARRKATLVRR